MLFSRTITPKRTECRGSTPQSGWVPIMSLKIKIEGLNGEAGSTAGLTAIPTLAYLFYAQCK